MAVPLGDIEPLRSLLAPRPLCIASDIDGTLAPIVPRPEDARVSPACRQALGELVSRGVKVVLATGRTLDVAREMVDVDGVAFAANHGLTVWLGGREETPPELQEYLVAARQLLAEAGAGLAEAGVTVEDKGPVLAFHFRRAPDEGVARAAIAAAVGRPAVARTFRVHEGRKVIELRPPLAIDKGTALAGMVLRLGARAVICMGDDATDIDMFRWVARLRGQGLPGASVAVASSEATPEVVAAADYRVEGVAGVEWLLGELLRALPATPP
jgi:trehalose 6-phosphate phosphatase